MKLEKIVGNVCGKNILLLQGPMGGYFTRIGRVFKQQGANIYRIGFNYADEFFADKQNYTPYKDTPKKWQEFIENFYKNNKIDMIFTFGDCRFYQKHAVCIAKKLNIKVFIFEEGYIRPYFITLEKNGVNFKSSIPRNREFYDALDSTQELLEIKKFGSTYYKMAFKSAIYYVLGNIFYYKYPNYHHHRDFSALKELYFAMVNLYRKNINRIKEQGLQDLFENKLSKQYYLAIFQTAEDFQIKTHCDFKNMEDFAKEVIKSFVKHAPKDSYLVFKHHPMDRGKKNYTKYIKKLSSKYNIDNRVIVTWDIHLPTLLKQCRACITINSTVGISALYHAIPTICLGRSFYDIEGLTSKDMSLDDFWIHHKEVNTELFDKFKNYLIQTTQINDNFYI